MQKYFTLGSLEISHSSFFFGVFFLTTCFYSTTIDGTASLWCYNTILLHNILFAQHSFATFLDKFVFKPVVFRQQLLQKEGLLLGRLDSTQVHFFKGHENSASSSSTSETANSMNTTPFLRLLLFVHRGGNHLKHCHPAWASYFASCLKQCQHPCHPLKMVGQLGFLQVLAHCFQSSHTQIQDCAPPTLCPPSCFRGVFHFFVPAHIELKDINRFSSFRFFVCSFFNHFLLLSRMSIL